MGTSNDVRLRKTYHSACQSLSALLAPVGISLIAFARPALFVWSGNENLSNATAPVLALLAAGFLTNARSEEHTSELQSLMRISYAVFCLKKKTKIITITIQTKKHTTYIGNEEYARQQTIVYRR